LVSNRFIRSPICWGDAGHSGLPSPAEQSHCVSLAKGGVGLIIPGFTYSLPHDSVFYGQSGFSSDAHANAWLSTVQAIHSHGSKVIFQIGHAGARADPVAIDGVPRGAWGFLPGTRAMTIAEIEDLIESFRIGAQRLMRIGVDGVMLHCAHGYGLSQFLSPVSNRRSDRYGGSIENRARIVQEIAREIKKIASADFAVICKINGHDGVEGGVTPEVCGKSVELISKEGVELFEISTGFGTEMAMVMSRSILKEGRSVRNPRGDENERWKAVLKTINPEFPFSYGYTAKYAEIIRRMNPGVELAIVGGNREFKAMESLVSEGKCEMVSIGRPFIRDPNLINRFKSGELDGAECLSCGQCFLRRPAQCLFPEE
jgi:2,4-dienoyl-CoA reductase-like NADH-dependent reductase (Old Yellow Enzyme family)